MMQKMTDQELAEWVLRRLDANQPIPRATTRELAKTLLRKTLEEQVQPRRTWKDAWGLFDRKKAP
jgi:hypothetical protein